MRSRKGFTLLELVIVIIILGVLATLGIGQYARMIERARGGEAREVLGMIRTQALGFYLRDKVMTGCTLDDVGIGPALDRIPSVCRTSNLFSYNGAVTTATSYTATATRCTAGGKSPNAPTAGTLILTLDAATGIDSWAGTGGY